MLLSLLLLCVYEMLQEFVFGWRWVQALGQSRNRGETKESTGGWKTDFSFSSFLNCLACRLRVKLPSLETVVRQQTTKRKMERRKEN